MRYHKQPAFTLVVKGGHAAAQASKEAIWERIAKEVNTVEAYDEVSRIKMECRADSALQQQRKEVLK
jgi:hypothetical protein